MFLNQITSVINYINIFKHYKDVISRIVKTHNFIRNNSSRCISGCLKSTPIEKVHLLAGV